MAIETTTRTIGEILEIAKYHEKYYCNRCKKKIIRGDYVHINSDCIYSCKHCGTIMEPYPLEYNGTRI
jgi:ribosomal protein L37AE/L43A